MKQNITKLMLGLALIGAVSVVGCGDAEQVYDCAKICDGYSDCIDDSIDKSDCVKSCKDHGDDDMDFAEQASDCESCIDDKSCADAALSCTTKCASVVAASTDD